MEKQEMQSFDFETLKKQAASRIKGRDAAGKGWCVYPTS